MPFIKNNIPKVKLASPKTTSADALDITMLHGKIAKNKEDIRAIKLFLKKVFASKYTAKIVREPKNAEGNLDANSLTPNKKVAKPEKYIGKTGGKSPNLSK